MCYKVDKDPYWGTHFFTAREEEKRQRRREKERERKQENAEKNTVGGRLKEKRHQKEKACSVMGEGKRSKPRKRDGEIDQETRNERNEVRVRSGEESETRG